MPQSSCAASLLMRRLNKSFFVRNKTNTIKSMNLWKLKQSKTAANTNSTH